MIDSAPNRNESKIQIKGLKKSFGNQEVLKGLDIEVKQGGVVALIGPSGSGKSTLLRCLNLLITPDAGSLRIGANRFRFDQKKSLPRYRVLAKFRATTGMVFQDFNLFPHKTALQNVMEAPIYVKKMPKALAHEMGMEQLRKVGLENFAMQMPHTLSGGQKQRVAIARALAMNPEVMLFDEVTSALDPELVGEVLGTMKQLASDGMTMIIVTHEIAFARDVADRVVFMRNGVVVEDGPAREVVNNPKQEATRNFLNHFHGTAL